MIIGTVEKARIFWQASSPSSPGIMRSRMMRLYSPEAAICTAVSPS